MSSTLAQIIGAAVPAHRTFCSAACVHVWKLTSQPAYARRMVGRRDHGICVECHPDVQRLIADADAMTSIQMPHLQPGSRERHDAFMTLLSPHRCGAWEMDHILPVVEGGGVPDDIAALTAEAVLANLRTLCRAHHRAVAAALARRRAEARRAAAPQTALPGIG
jgi:5-methylcytosine-specific restriction endonuclease McrA